MKKFLLVVAAVAMVFSFSSCKKNASKYGGTYVGTYQFFKYNSETGTNEQDGAVQNGKKVPVLQITDDRVQLYGIIGLDRISDGQYKTVTSGELAKSLLMMVGVSEDRAERVKDITFTADFSSSNHLSYTMNYELEILNGLTSVEIHILKFEGDKQ